MNYLLLLLISIMVSIEGVKFAPTAVSDGDMFSSPILTDGSSYTKMENKRQKHLFDKYKHTNTYKARRGIDELEKDIIKSIGAYENVVHPNRKQKKSGNKDKSAKRRGRTGYYRKRSSNPTKGRRTHLKSSKWRKPAREMVDMWHIIHPAKYRHY